MHFVLLAILAADPALCADETLGDAKLEALAREFMANDLETASRCVDNMVHASAELCLAVYSQRIEAEGWGLEHCARGQKDPLLTAKLLAEAGERKRDWDLLLEAQALDPSEGMLRRLTSSPVRRLSCVAGKSNIPIDATRGCEFPSYFVEPVLLDTRRWEGFVLARVHQSDSWAHGAWASETLLVIRPEADGASLVATFELLRSCTGRCTDPKVKNPVQTKGRTLTWKKLRFDSQWFRVIGTGAPVQAKP